MDFLFNLLYNSGGDTVANFHHPWENHQNKSKRTPMEVRNLPETHIVSKLGHIIQIQEVYIQSRCPSLCSSSQIQGVFSCTEFSSVQSLSRVQLFAAPWITARQASLSITNSRSLLKLMPIESVMPSSHLILCRPLLLLSPIPPRIRVFSNESTLRMRWSKYWSFRFSTSPSNEHPGLISFRMDWLDLLAVQGTLKNLLQHHSSKASVFRSSVFFTVQLSHPYMTTGKTIALTRRSFVGKAMSLLLHWVVTRNSTFLVI